MESISASTPLVTFVVMCYQTERYVQECIESILSQDRSIEWEVVAVDDCSLDRTGEILEQMRDDRLRVIRQPKNCGHITSLTTGLEAAKGRYIARIDSDDRYRSDFLSSVLSIFDRYPEVGLVYGDTAIIDAFGNECAARSDRHHNGQSHRGNELVELLRENFICAPTVIARRELWMSCLPIPNHLCFTDWYVNVTMARHSAFYYLNHVLADYRVHPGNMHSRMTLDGSEEKTILWILGSVFNSAESDSNLESEKQHARRTVYGDQYWTLANKYFGAGMYRDARRCYLNALSNQPRRVLSPELQRRLAATVCGPKIYNAVKRYAKTVV